MTRVYKALPPVSELWARLEYKPLTGELIWRVGRRAGRVAGRIHATGYCVIRFNAKDFYAHRLVYAWCLGALPATAQVDHKDQNKQNNRWRNLRLATNTSNSWNRKANKNNKVGFKGVSRARSGRFIAVLHQGKNKLHLGTYDTPELASAAYERASREIHGEFSPNHN